ncbi:hypothetical protein PIB30_044640 [Stylosanthes scabra]|uniref:Uncharacterized protein n=1 Tax=Stylosanthes scabra TaxID=79078 RepID=A0ABU6VFG7_9FABA|nr:hypothetical protein [Stylosanthes scabra]
MFTSGDWCEVSVYGVQMYCAQAAELCSNLDSSEFLGKKGVDRGIWVALSSHQGRTVFSLFKPLYRDFKNFYIKVKSSDDAFPFFLDEKLSSKFPLYWNERSVKCLGVEELCERDACVSEFLFENLRGEKILTTSVLLRWESDRSMVIRYLETKVPDCNTASLKSFFKQRGEREVSS